MNKKNNLSKKGGCGTCGLPYDDPRVYDGTVHHHENLIFFQGYIAYPRGNDQYYISYPVGGGMATSTELALLKEVKALQAKLGQENP